MSRLLLLVPGLHYSGPARQVSILAPQLAEAGGTVHVCALGGETPLAAQLRQQGLSVTTLGRGQRWHLPGLRRLRQLLREFQPDVIHAWKMSCVRALALILGSRRPRLLVSSPLQPAMTSVHLHWFDRWLLRRADCIICRTCAEAQRCCQLGLPPDRLIVIPPAVERPKASPGTAIGERTIVCIGPLEPHKGFYEAIWAFDMLRHMQGVDRLCLVGAGSDLPRLRRFTEHLGLQDCVHFLGPVPDLKPSLRQARVVWVPSLAPGGLHVALDALAAGVPVVASALPELAELITEEKTGFLVPPGDRVLLARRTRLLLEDDNRAERFLQAAQARIREHFTSAALVPNHLAIYHRQVA